MTDTSKLVAEASAISSKSPAIKTFALDAAANLVDQAARIAKLEAAVAALQPAPVPPLTPMPSPTPSPAPAPGAVRDDKRATPITQLKSAGWNYANPSPGVHTLVQSVNGSQDWANAFGGTFSALQFSNSLYQDGDEPTHPDGDIWLADDPRYGKVFHVGCGKHSHTPFFDHVSTNPDWYLCHDSMLSWQRPVYTDQTDKSWDWYAVPVKYEAGWDTGTSPDFSMFMEVGYPVIQNPPFQLGLFNGAIQGHRLCGVMSGVKGSYTYSENEAIPPLLAYKDIVGKWVEYLIGIYWSSQSKGSMIIKTRCKDNGETGFTPRWSRTNINTWQWVNGTSSVANGTIANDLFGTYEGWPGSKAYHDGTFPRHDLETPGWVRCPTEADALTYLP